MRWIGSRAPSMSRRRYRIIRFGSTSWATGRCGGRLRRLTISRRCRRLTEEALRAGAFGFTTSRTEQHKTTKGDLVPGRFAENQELFGIGAALGRTRTGAFGMLSDFDDEDAEFEWMSTLAKSTGRPLWFLLTDRSQDPDRYNRLMNGVRRARAGGASVTAQVAGRPVGIILGLTTSLNPFAARPAFAALTGLVGQGSAGQAA